MPNLSIINYKKKDAEQKEKPVQYVGLVVPKSGAQGSENLNALLKNEMSDDPSVVSHPFYTCSYYAESTEVFDKLIADIMENEMDTNQHELHLIEITDSKETIENRFDLTEGQKPSVANLKSFFEEVSKNYVAFENGHIKITEMIMQIKAPTNMLEFLQMMALLESLLENGFHRLPMNTSNIIQSLGLLKLTEVPSPRSEVQTPSTVSVTSSTPSSSPIVEEEGLVTMRRKK